MGFWGKSYGSRKKCYPYDNFVKCNMSEEGYKKMKACLGRYLGMESTELQSQNVPGDNDLGRKK